MEKIMGTMLMFMIVVFPSLSVLFFFGASEREAAAWGLGFGTGVMLMFFGCYLKNKNNHV